MIVVFHQKSQQWAGGQTGRRDRAGRFGRGPESMPEAVPEAVPAELLPFLASGTVSAESPRESDGSGNIANASGKQSGSVGVTWRARPENIAGHVPEK